MSYTSKIDEWDTSLKVNALWERWPFRGRREVRDGAGDLIETWRDKRPSIYTEAYASGEASRALAGGILRINGRFGWEGFFYDFDSLIYGAAPADASADFNETFGYDSQTVRGEFGVDFSRTLGGDWTWKLIGLASGRDFAEDQRRRRYTLPAHALASRTELSLDQRPAEAIARTTFARAGDHALRPEFGVEVAYNRLESALELEVNGAPINLPASNVLVQESRGEAFANAAWKFAADWTLEGGIAAEISKIEVTGDASEEQSFVFWKPSVAAIWAAGAKTQLKVGVRHTVGQLDFTDFAASAQIQDDIPIAGNPSLMPTQTTRAYALVDYRWGSQGALTLEVFGERRKDVLEYVILPSGGEGISNAGEADFWGLIGSTNVPLNWLVEGAKIKANATLSASRFLDPLTGAERDVNGLATPTIDVEFRHDIEGEPWAWGLRYTAATEVVYYYVGEVDAQPSSERYGAFVETVLDDGLKFVLTLREITTQRWERERSFFEPDRGGTLVRTEHRWNTRGTFVNLTASATF
jgi:hypothetical protein